MGLVKARKTTSLFWKTREGFSEEGFLELRSGKISIKEAKMWRTEGQEYQGILGRGKSMQKAVSRKAA